MRLRNRRLIYLTFVFIFLAAAPLLLLYTQGYRFNAKRSNLSLTGTLVVSTIPSGADVILNDQPLPRRTPETFSSIPPAIYRIRLEKPEYRSWEKQMSITPGGALFVSNVHLWRDALPIALADGDYRQLAASPDGREIVLTDIQDRREQFWRFTVTGELLSLVSERSVADGHQTEELQWSPQSNEILVRSDAGSSILDLASSPPRLYDLPRSTSAFQHWRWSETDAATLYASDGQALFRVDTKAMSVTPLALRSPDGGSLGTITDFWVTATTVNVLSRRPNTAAELRLYELTGGTPTAIFPLPTIRSYRYRASSEDFLVLQDNDGRATLWRLTANSLLPLLTAPQVTVVSFRASGRELLYTTSHELWTYNTATDTKTLLTRLGAAIAQPAWYTDGSHVLFAADRAFFIMERDERDLRNRWPLFSFAKLVGYALNESGTTMYFAGSLGAKSSLWRLDLQ